MGCQVEVLTVPSSDSPREPVVVLSYYDKKYLFNCGEGTSRALIGAGVLIRQIDEVFLTSGWESHGGLCGLLLHMSGHQSINRIGLHGPKNLAYYLATLRAGQQRRLSPGVPFDVSIEEYHTELPAAYEDNSVVVQPVLAFPQPASGSNDTESAPDSSVDDAQAAESNQIHTVAQSVWSGRMYEQMDGVWQSVADDSEDTKAEAGDVTATSPTSDGRSARSHKRRKTDVPRPQGVISVDPGKYRAYRTMMDKSLPENVKPFPVAVSYFIQGHPVRGKFDPIRAKALGISPGPAYGRLQKGFSVQTKDNRTVQPSDVIGPPRILPAILFIHCPSKIYLPAVCEHAFWQTCHGDKEPMAIIHSCGSEVLEDERYVQFMASFGSGIKHFISNQDHVADGIVHQKSADFLASLQNLSDEIYLVPAVSPKTLDMSPKFADHAVNLSILSRGTCVTSYPSPSITNKQTSSKPTTPQVQAALAEYTKQCKEAHLRCSRDSRTGTMPASDVEILTLGTGSAGPSGYRNVSGNLILNPGEFSILLDCGEGTVGQMRRAFGDELDTQMRALRIVFISHLHADHHLGTIGLLRTWTACNKDNDHSLYVICTERYSRSIREYASIEDLNMHRIIFIASRFLIEPQNRHRVIPEEVRQILNVMRQELPGLRALETAPCVHSPEAMFFRVDHKQGWSVAYSGDTRPSPVLARLAKNVTCLIHEATFDDEKIDEAVKKRHSTISEAIYIAQEAKAHSTLLTHFSQRYAKVPILNGTKPEDLSNLNIGFAVDLMRIKIKDIWKLAHHLPPQINLARTLEGSNSKDNEEAAEIFLD